MKTKYPELTETFGIKELIQTQLLLSSAEFKYEHQQKEADRIVKVIEDHINKLDKYHQELIQELRVDNGESYSESTKEKNKRNFLRTKLQDQQSRNSRGKDQPKD